MTRHHVNNLIEDAKLAGFVVVDGLFQSVLDAEDGYIPLAGKFAQTTPYTFKALAVENSTKIFDILAENVPYKVCIEVIKRKMDWVEEIRANGTENACHENDNNEIDFFFNAELREKPEMQENTCRSSRDCPQTAPYCRNGYCTKCETGMQLTNGECINCASNLYAIHTSKQYCHLCPESIVLSNGSCYHCSVANITFKTTREECDLCSNNYFDDTEKCYQCSNALGVHHILPSECETVCGGIFRLNEKGICDCPENSIPTDGKKCVNCSDVYGAKTTKEFCHLCSEGVMLSNNLCYRCSRMNESLNISEEECNRCLYHYYDTQTKKCPSCPPGQKKSPSDSSLCIDI